ncbi:MAG: MetS family NSS transporter small subunit [Cyclobacteriaceae bacterium]|nr:MetS family NSS transporter small subunit [Cyclobacteriaceae bacterium]MCH8515966.1 MetS family NSS transporter small subunit [Cyclobacteriaceae bacterium]
MTTNAIISMIIILTIVIGGFITFVKTAMQKEKEKDGKSE